MFLEGKKALITGSTSGIGLAVARALHAEGAKIVLNGFGDDDEIAGLREELGGAAYFDSDLTDPDAIETMMKDAGGIDILVNNAGMQHVSPVDEFPPAKWDAIIALNLSAAFHTIRLVTVNCISPGYVWTPLVENQIPDTMKARDMSREEVIDQVLLAKQPTKKFVQPEDIGEMAVFLCRDSMANVNGANWSVDGGWTAE